MFAMGQGDVGKSTIIAGHSLFIIIKRTSISGRNWQSMRACDMGGQRRSKWLMCKHLQCVYARWYASLCVWTLDELQHYILRVLKTSQSCSRRQICVFQSTMTQGIQKWVQNNQLSSLPSNDFFKKLFLAPKIIKKIGHFVDFWIVISI